MTATIFAAPAAEQPIIPTSYTIRVTVTRCNSCNSVNRQSEFLALTLIKPRMGVGSPTKNWKECKRPEYNLPIDRVFVNRATPFCAECDDAVIDAFMALLPNPPHASGLHDLPEVALKGAPAKKPAAPAAKPRIEDLA